MGNPNENFKAKPEIKSDFGLKMSNTAYVKSDADNY